MKSIKLITNRWVWGRLPFNKGLVTPCKIFAKYPWPPCQWNHITGTNSSAASCSEATGQHCLEFIRIKIAFS